MRASSRFILQDTEIESRQKEPPKLAHASASITTVQAMLALGIMTLVIIVTVSAIFTPRGESLLETLLPTLMFILGYFFPRYQPSN